jgi:hypothetical protein
MAELRYPIGCFVRPETVTESQLAEWTAVLAGAPALAAQAVQGLTDQQLDTPYREGGWTVRQVIHHMADSHQHAAMRFRFALVEEQPQIKPYEEAVWATLPDAAGAPVEPSLAILTGVHDRWVHLIQALEPAQFARTFLHPESGWMRLDQQIGLYAWHTRHHLAQITGLRERMCW